MEDEVLRQKTRGMPEVARERFIRPLQRRQLGREEEQQQKDREEMPEFHCPWVDCHSVSGLLTSDVEEGGGKKKS